MRGSRFVDITPLPGGEREKVYGFVGGELSILKLGSVLVGFSWGVLNFSWKPTRCGQTMDGSLGRVQIFILAERCIKIEVFGIIRQREQFGWHTYCQPCVHVDFAPLSVHMIRKFTIQGFHTLNIELISTLLNVAIKTGIIFNTFTVWTSDIATCQHHKICRRKQQYFSPCSIHQQ